MNTHIYIKSDSGRIVILELNRESLRCRQRNLKTPGFRFVSYKEMMKHHLQFNKGIIGPVSYNTISKL